MPTEACWLIRSVTIPRRANIVHNTCVACFLRIMYHKFVVHQRLSGSIHHSWRMRWTLYEAWYRYPFKLIWCRQLVGISNSNVGIEVSQNSIIEGRIIPMDIEHRRIMHNARNIARAGCSSEYEYLLENTTSLAHLRQCFTFSSIFSSFTSVFLSLAHFWSVLSMLSTLGERTDGRGWTSRIKD